MKEKRVVKKIVFIVINDFLHESRVLKEAVSLKELGYSVRVIALYEKKLKEKEIIEGIEIERIKLMTRLWPRSFIIRLIKYLEFSFKLLCRHGKADIYHCSRLDSLPVSFFLRLFNRKVKIVYDAHEFETEANPMIKGWEKKVMELIEKILIKKADAVISVCRSIAVEYARIYKIKEPYLVLNTPKYVKYLKNDKFREEFNIPTDKMIVLYQGILGVGRGTENIIESIKFIKSNLCIIFMGWGTKVDYVINKAREYPGKIYYKPAVPPSELLKYTASADIGLCLIENSCLSYYYCLPNKLFEYQMAGLPVVVSDFPEMEKVVKKEYDCGLTVNPESPEAIASKIDELINNRELFKRLKANTELAARKYNWENQEKVLKEIYEAI